MILAPQIVLRLVLLGIFAAILQLSFFGKLSVLGASPDFAVLVVLSLALLGGSLTGAVAGFSIGLLIDCLLLQTTGASALTLLMVGYVAGRYRENVGLPTRGATALLGGGMTLLAALFFGFLQVMIGVESAVSPLIVRDIIVVSAMGMAFAVPVFWLVRRVLRPALIDDVPRSSRPLTPNRAARPARSRTPVHIP